MNQIAASLVGVCAFVALLAAAAPVDPQLKALILEVDSAIPALERESAELTRKFYFDQLDAAAKVAKEDASGALALRAIALKFTKAQQTRRFIFQAAHESIKDFLFSEKDTKFDGKTKLSPMLSFDAAMVRTLTARAKLRAAVDGFLFTSDDWKLIFGYVKRLAAQQPAGEELKALVRDVYARLQLERELTESLHEEQVRRLAEYKSGHADLAAVADETIVFEMDKLIDVWVGCPSCSQFKEDDDDDEAYGTYPMFLEAYVPVEGAAKAMDRELRKSMAETERSVAAKLPAISADELEDTDLGDFDELVEKVLGN